MVENFDPKSNSNNIWHTINLYASKQDHEVIIKQQNSTVICDIYKKNKVLFLFSNRKFVNRFYYTLKEPYDQTPFSNAILETILGDTNIDFTSYMGFVTSVFNRKDDVSDILQATLKMSTEMAEVSDIVADEIFFKKEISRSSKIAEMGDILFYYTLILAKWKFSLSEVMATNFIKLKSRYPNGRYGNNFIYNKDIKSENKQIEDYLSENERSNT